MIWLTSFAFTLLLLLSQHGCAQSKSSRSGGLSKSPFADPAKANVFMSCLIQEIAASSVFPQQEKEDLESIVETMMSAITSMSAQAGHGNNKAQLQAMNMAFASSMAELVIAEDIGDMQSVSLKTDALAQALQRCFMNTMGSVNNAFIAEIKDLIKMFAQEAAAQGEENEIEESGMPQYPGAPGFGGTGAGGISQTTSFSSTSYSVSGFGGLPGPTTGSPVDTFVQRLTSILSSSNAVRSIVNSNVQPQTLIVILTSAIQSGMQSVGFDAMSIQAMSSSVQTSVSRLGQQIKDFSNVVTTISQAIAQALQKTGKLTSSNAGNLADQVGRGFISSVSSIAAQYGIKISGTSTTSSTTTVSGMTSSIAGAMGPSGPGFPGAPGGGSPNDIFVQKLSTLLSNSDVMRSIVSSNVPAQTLGGLLVSAFQTGIARVEVDFSTSQAVVRNVQTAVSSLGSRVTDISAVSMSVSQGAAQGLSSTGILNSSNAGDLADQIGNSLVSALRSSASQYGINISATTTFGGVSGSVSVTGGFGGPVGPGFPSAPGVAGDASTTFTQGVISALSSSSAVDSVLSAGLDSQRVSSLFVSAVLNGMGSVGIDSFTAQTLASSIQSSLSTLGSEASDVSRVVETVATGSAQALQSSGRLTSSSARELADNVANGIISGIQVVGPQFSITLPGPRGPGFAGPGAPGFGKPTAPGFGAPGAGFSRPGSPGISGGASTSASFNMASVLSSSAGLKSPQATSRINNLAGTLSNAIRPEGVDMNSLAQGIGSMLPQIQSSGMSGPQAVIEAMMETLVALIQLLASQSGTVNTSTTLSTSNSLASAFSSMLQ